MFLASTINGYEGTGRSLSLKLLEQLRSQANITEKDNKKECNAIVSTSMRRKLYEITLEESIRYNTDDAVKILFFMFKNFRIRNILLKLIVCQSIKLNNYSKIKSFLIIKNFFLLLIKFNYYLSK